MPLHPFTKDLQQHRVEGDETTNDEYNNHNGSFGVYFRNKQIKLDTQAKQKFTPQTNIFGNCVIYITGYTVPSAVELKRLIVENGGQVCAFLGGKSYASHIVASSLTSRKTELYANYKVVKPAWIIESVKLGRTLDWTRYRTLHNVGNLTFESNSLAVGTTNDPTEELEEEASPSKTIVQEEHLRDEILGEESDLLDVPGVEGDRARINWIENVRARVNCLKPDFIRDYFSKSRLHFLTNKKLELRKRCRQYESEYSQQSYKYVHRTILHVDFDSFFVAISLKKFPHLVDKPVCVSFGSDGSDVASCNYVAREHGVTNGMWVARAKQVCPALICIPYDFEEYTVCSDHLYDTLLELRPFYITAVSVDEALVDISNLIYGGERTVESICDHIREKVKALTKVEVSIGVGSNILLAKLALKKAKPAGSSLIADPSEIKDFNVKDLPGVGRHLYSQLSQELGVTTVADLQKISLSDLQSKIGNAIGQKLYGYARGMDSGDISSLDTPIKSVGLDIGWGVRVINEEEKRIFVTNCSDELWNRLVTSGTAMEQLTVKVYVKSTSCSFVAPKHLGHGLCEILSRSKRMIPRTTLGELKENVLSLVTSIHCQPLDFRGLGLHLRVTEPIPKANAINQAFLPKVHRNDRTPTSLKREMVSVPPRKKRIGMTMTQMLPGLAANEDAQKEMKTWLGPNELGDVDMSVLAELPSQIRKEIMLHEDDYHIVPSTRFPVGPPLYKLSRGFGVEGPERLREVIKKWVQTSKAPTAEDAKSFWEYIRDALQEDSAWTAVLDTCEWFELMVQMYGEHPNWFELSTFLNDQAQRIAIRRF